MDAFKMNGALFWASTPVNKTALQKLDDSSESKLCLIKRHVRHKNAKKQVAMHLEQQLRATYICSCSL